MNAEEETITMKITVNGKIYTIFCAPGEEKELKDAAALLDQSISEARRDNQSSIVSDERLVMVTALNIAHQLRQAQKRRQEEEQAMARRIDAANRYLRKRTSETVAAAELTKDFATAL